MGLLGLICSLPVLGHLWLSQLQTESRAGRPWCKLAEFQDIILEGVITMGCSTHVEGWGKKINRKTKEWGCTANFNCAAFIFKCLSSWERAEFLENKVSFFPMPASNTLKDGHCTDCNNEERGFASSQQHSPLRVPRYSDFCSAENSK